MPQITVDLNDLELEDLDRRAAAVGMDRAAYARYSLTHAPRTGRPATDGSLGERCYASYRDKQGLTWTEVADLHQIGMGRSDQKRADLARKLARGHSLRRDLPWPIR